MAELDELPGRLAALEQRLRALQSEVCTMKRDNRDLRAEVTDLSQQVADRDEFLRSMFHEQVTSRDRIGPLERMERQEAARARQDAAALLAQAPPLPPNVRRLWAVRAS